MGTSMHEPVLLAQFSGGRKPYLSLLIMLDSGGRIWPGTILFIVLIVSTHFSSVLIFSQCEDSKLLDRMLPTNRSSLGIT